MNTLLKQLNTLEDAGLIQLAALQPELEYLFRHALVQDAAYGSLLKQDRKQLHQSVAAALEMLSPDQLDDNAATLAYHYEKAEAWEQAVHYLTRAGDHAYSGGANAEAITFYQSALHHVTDRLQPFAPDVWSNALAQLWEKLAETVERIGQHEAARAHFRQALTLTKNEPLTQSRLYRRIGATHTLEKHFQQAMDEWEQAEHCIGKPTEQSDTAHWHEWLEIQVERLWLHYWQNQPEAMEAICRELIPQSERLGTVVLRARVLMCYSLYRFRHERYVVSDDSLHLMQKVLRLSLKTKRAELIHDAYFGLGFFHLFRREFAEAEEALLNAVRFAERLGDPVRIARGYNYLMFLARMRGQVEKALSHLPTIQQTTWAGPMADYTSQIRACQCWAAWRKSEYAQAKALGLDAFTIDQKGAIKSPFRWTFFFPLLAIARQEQDTVAAREYAQKLLEPMQMRLPDDLTETLQLVIHATDDETTQGQLATAIELAQRYGYL